MNKQKTNNVDHWLYMICWFWKELGWLWKEPFVWKLSWAQLLVVLAFAVCLELVVDRLFCIFCFFFLVVPNRIIFSSIESIVDATGLEQSREQRANVLKARAWNDWRQKQLNKFLTSLSRNEANVTTNRSIKLSWPLLNTPKTIKEK